MSLFSGALHTRAFSMTKRFPFVGIYVKPTGNMVVSLMITVTFTPIDVTLQEHRIRLPMM